MKKKNSIKLKLDQIFKTYKNLYKISSIIQKSCEICLGTINTKKKIIFCGNGGSAADSQHLAAELVGKFLKKRIALPSIALTTNSSILTAVGNDLNFNQIFSRQIEALGNEGDTLVALTTSGKSKNILNAIKTAEKKKLNIVLITSKKSKLKSKEKLLVVKAPATRVDRIQEMHITIGHIICEYIENNFKK